MKKTRVIVPLLLAVALALGFLLGGYFNFPAQHKRWLTNNPKNKLNRLLELIDTEYVDSVNTDSIVDLTVNNILAQLDPHSVYMSPSVQAEEAQNMKGDFVGVGINFFLYKDTVAVVKSLENGPSAKAGILPGDRILYAGKTRLYGRKLDSEYLFSEFRGEEGSPLELTVYRKSIRKKFMVHLKRAVVPIKSVDAALMLTPTVGYLKINRFAETTYAEFQEGMTRLRNAGMKTFLIDLRDNSGGYMEMAVKIADELLPNKKLIVFTKDKKGKIEKAYATDRGDFEEGKVCVLINENSASASEILAGAIQDNDRGIIIGRRSFGKGLVQKETSFDDGSAVRLTIARYYTPTGRSIQKPYKKGDEADYENEFNHRFENGELYDKDSIKVADSLKFKTKKGKIVYGGGGIVPDVFVPLEGKKGEESIPYIMQESGIVSNFVFEQLDENRAKFSKMGYQKTVDYLSKTDEYLNRFQRHLDQMGLHVRLSQNKSLVKKYLTAEFAQQLFGDQKYYEIALKNDPVIEAALKQ